MRTEAPLVPDSAQLPDDVGLLKELVAQLWGTIQDRERRIAQLEQHLHLLVKRFLHPASEKIESTPMRPVEQDSTGNPPASIAAPAPAATVAAGAAAPGLPPELLERFSSAVIVAPKPLLPIPGGLAGPGLLAQVLVSKYGDHLPLHRLERIFARQGVHFTRQTLCDWCAGCARLTRPLSDLAGEEVLASFVVHTDDTPVDVRDAHAKQKFQARFWTYVGDEQHRLTWFDFTTTHQRAGPDRVLAGYRGSLQADGYGGYDDYEGVQLGEDSPILKVACWAHGGSHAGSWDALNGRRC